MNFIVTPTNNFGKSFLKTILCLQKQSISNWEWIIVNDSDKPLNEINITQDIVKLISDDSRINIINNNYSKGAGAARNYALDYIKKKSKVCYLFFIDAGDEWIDTFLEDSIANLKLFNTNIVSGSYVMQWKDGKRKEVIRSGQRNYKNMLEDYSTSCLSTSLKIDDTTIFSEIRFGETIRVNDQPFFLSAVKYFGSVQQISDIQATYHVGDLSSLSGKKIYTAFGKWKVLKKQNLPLILRCYYFTLYFLNGFKKYYM